MADFNFKKYYKDLARTFQGGPGLYQRIASRIAAPGEVIGSPIGTATAFLKQSTNVFANHMSNYGTYSRLARYCITGDMLVMTNSEQGYLPMKELVQRFEAGQRVFTFAYDKASDEMVCVPVAKAWKTKRDRIWEVHFDDGLVLRCTGDHNVMLRDGSYREAQRLLPGDAVMPFNRYSDGRYRSVRTNGRAWGYVFEHRLVMEMVHGKDPEIFKNKHVHHINECKTDNRIENLELMDAFEHVSLHTKEKNAERWAHPEEHSHMSEIAKARWSEDGDLRQNQAEIVRKRMEHSSYAIQQAKLIERNKTNPPGVGNAGREDQKNFDNANADKSFTFQHICNAYKKGMTLTELCKVTGQQPRKIRNRLKWEGYTSWQQFAETYANHKVARVIKTDDFEDVYDLTIEKYHNFAVGQFVDNSLKSLMISNSDYNEMESLAEISSALDIYAHEICAKGEYGEILRIESPNAKIKEVLIKLFYDTLNLEFNAAPWLRSLCKYGDYLMLVDHHPDYGVMGVFPMPINEVEREEGYDKDSPTAYRYRWVAQGNKMLDPWQVIHFRLLANDGYLPYGTSVLEAARRAWRQLILMEDAVMVYRIVRSPERRVFYIDVGNVAPADVPALMENTMTRLKRDQVVDSTTGQVDLRYNALPVHHATPIPLLDGRTITIKELAKEYDEGKENWVYSINDATHQIVPGKVAWCGKNYAAKELVKVTLDDGTYVITAPEHPFILRNGLRCRADELKIDDSLMPLYRRVNSAGYETVYNPRTNRHEKTHRLVAEDVFAEEFHAMDHPIVHHREFSKGEENKKNNTPANLQVVTSSQHATLHSDRLIEYNKSDAHRKAISEASRLHKSGERVSAFYNGTELHKSHNGIRREAQKKSWSENKEWRSKRMEWNIPTECLPIAKEIYKNNQTLPRDAFIEKFKSDDRIKRIILDANAGFKRDFSALSRFVFENFLKANGYKTFGEFKVECTGKIKNHHVIAIETLQVADVDVYCMTVVGAEGQKDRHNFAVCSLTESGMTLNGGIIVNNSTDVDYFLPVRGGESGTKIDTLPGGQFTGDIDDLQYIQNKLFAALKIPKSYLGYESDLSGKSTLSQEDIRFARTIQHIQRVFLAELEKIAMIHLYSIGLRDEEMLNFTLSMANPSTINEIQRLELWRARFEVASIATGQDGVLDKNFIYRHIFKLSEDDIEGIEEGRRKDKAFQLELDAMQPPIDESMQIAPEGTDANAAPGGGGGPVAGDAGAAAAAANAAANPEASNPGSVTADASAPLDNNGVGESVNWFDGSLMAEQGIDPNQQRAMGNSQRGRVKRQKPFGRKDDLRKNVYDTEKNGLDPMRDVDLLRRVVTAPFAENEKQDEFENAMFEKRISQLNRFADLSNTLSKVPGMKKGNKKLIT